MKHVFAIALALLIVVGPLAAQQANQGSLASLTVNGVVSSTGPIRVDIPRGSTIPVTIQGLPSQPFEIWYSNLGARAPGFTVSGLGPQRIDLIATQPLRNLFTGFESSQFRVNASGTWTTSFTTSASTPIGRRLAVQAIVVNPSAPWSIPASLTAASDIFVAAGVSVVPLTGISDNGNQRILFSTYGLPFFPFYETTYDSAYVNSDGNITFTSGDGDFTPTPNEFHNGRPRIAPFWTDLNPTLGGSVTVRLDPNGPIGPEMLVDWVNLPVWQNTGGRHTFSAKIYHLTGDIEITHPFTNGQPIYDCFTGVGPGNGLRPPGASTFPNYTDFSTFGPTNPKITLQREAMWEWYGTTNMPFYTQGFNNVFDLTARTVFIQGLGAGTVGALYSMFTL